MQIIAEVVDEQKMVAYHPESREGLLYNFDKCHHQDATVQDIFSSVEPNIDAFLQGYSSAILLTGLLDSHII